MLLDSFLILELISYLNKKDLVNFINTSKFIKSSIVTNYHGDYIHVYNSRVIENYPKSVWLLDKNYRENCLKLIPCLKCGNLETIQYRSLDLIKYYKRVICPKLLNDSF